MLIAFKTPELELLFRENSDLDIRLGEKCYRKLKRRLDDLAAARSLHELINAPGQYAMINEKKGLFSCNLDHPYQLIFEPHKFPVPKTDNGHYDWNAIQGIVIVAITDQ